MSLYHISAEMQTVLDAMLEDGVNSPEASEALNAHLQGLDVALDQKAESYAGIITELNARAEVRKEEAARIRTLAAADEALATRLKERLKVAMETTGRLRIETPRFRLSVAQNGGKQPINIAPDAVDSLPSDLTVTTVEPDREKIRAALEGGTMLPGCELMPRGTSLRIK